MSVTAFLPAGPLMMDHENHVDIPESDLADAMRFTRAKTKREAIVAAIQDFNRLRRMAELVKHAGTCADMTTVEELQKQCRG